jgi:GNAT superfamily N-acetyltransferase
MENLPSSPSSQNYLLTYHPMRVLSWLTSLLGSQPTNNFQLSDVFILPSYQGKGLGKWLISCTNEVLESWPEMRATLLYAGGKTAHKFYADMMGMKPFVSGKDDLEIMVKLGPGDVMGDH